MVSLPRICAGCGESMYHYAQCYTCKPQQSEVEQLREVIRKVRAAPDMTAVWHITESAILKWGER